MQYNVNGVMLLHLISSNKDMDYRTIPPISVTAEDAEAAKGMVLAFACRHIKNAFKDASKFRWSGEPEVLEVPQDVIMREMGQDELFEYPGGEE